MRMSKKIKFIAAFLALVLSIGGISINSYANNPGADEQIRIDVYQFPESYQRKLLALKEQHPNWTFEPVYTGLKWEDAVNGEMQGSRSLISRSANSYCKGAEYGQGWYYASKDAVKYYMDPRNFLDQEKIFMFQDLHSYNGQISLADVDTFLNKTFMSSSLGYAPGTDMTFAQIFIKCGTELGVNPFHLASRVYQEQGKGKSPLISGTYPGYEGYYNYFNVSASGNTNEVVIINGLKYAKNRDWNNAYKSINGGADLIINKYVKCGQDTVYFEKFNVSPNSSYGKYTHQYMQNIMAPWSESKSMFSEYNSVGKVNGDFVFKIPVYEDMPRGACPYPSENSNTYYYNGVDYASVYSPDYYYDNNPDLAAAFGYDTNLLLKHYVECGINEGRRAKESFDIGIYKWNYYDLAQAFGDNNRAYVEHYIYYGQFEGREAGKVNATVYQGVDYSAVYSPEYYYNTYSDLAAAFGYDERALLKHFVNYGMKEGRCGNDTFNVLKYKYAYSNEDLMKVFGDDLPVYYLHYILYGASEGRSLSDWDAVFDAGYYLKNNPDVANYIYSTYTENSNIEGWCLWHYLEYGVYEGRRASANLEIFNYASANPGVFYAFSTRGVDGNIKTDFRLIARHYAEYGRAEGRRITNGKYNIKDLPKLRPDVIAVYGENNYAGWCDWFITYGGN